MKLTMTCIVAYNDRIIIYVQIKVINDDDDFNMRL